MRKPMITRTIQTTRATVMFIDTTDPTPYTNDIVLPRTYKNDDAMLKLVKQMCETSTIKAVAIMSSTVESALYGMTESDFVAHAHIIEKPSKADIDNDTENN